MSLIDKKWRIFGKINLLDFLIVITLIVVIPLFYAGNKINALRRARAAFKETIHVELNCKAEVKNTELGLVKAADKEIAKDFGTIGQILSIGSTSPFYYKFSLGGSDMTSVEDPDKKELDLLMKLSVTPRGNSIYYKDTQIEINSPFEFNTGKYILKVTPRPPSEDNPLTEMEIYVTLKDLTEDKIKLIAAGDTETDEENQPLAKIISVGQVESNTANINLGEGNFALGETPGLKQVVVKLRLKCRIGKDGSLFYKEELIDSKKTITFNTNRYSAIGYVVSSLVILPSENAPLELKEKWITLRVRFQDVIPEIEKLVSENDAARDQTKGKAIARIRQVLSIKPSDVWTINENQIVNYSHPFKKDIEAIISVLCVETNLTNYYNNYPVKIGNIFSFAGDLYNLSGTIIGIEDK